MIKAAQVDERRWLVMPPECPPGSTVTIQEVGDGSWLVHRQQEQKGYKVVLIPVIDRLPEDPVWEAIEKRMAERAWKQMPPFEE